MIIIPLSHLETVILILFNSFILNCPVVPYLKKKLEPQSIQHLHVEFVLKLIEFVSFLLNLLKNTLT